MGVGGTCLSRQINFSYGAAPPPPPPPPPRKGLILSALALFDHARYSFNRRVAINNRNTANKEANKDDVLKSPLRYCITRTSFFTKKEENLGTLPVFKFAVVFSVSDNLDFPFLFNQIFLEEFSSFIRVTVGLPCSFLILSKAGQCRINP